MQYTKTESYVDMGDFLASKFYAGEIEPDDWHNGDGYFFGRFGRRVLVDSYGYGCDYECFPTYREAIARMDELEDQRPPAQDMDAIVYTDRDYYVTAEGVDVGSFDSREDAVLAVARWMVDSGCFPDAFLVDNRGGWHRIDAEIRELHDDGGDRMRADLVQS